ncbi:fimbria/pilus outer membrane usher protein [Serratia microhaemolytica]|uniref:fimbria/pilus outer membrane usher protein n=1 Tax=Serratia microhaemolytica TaxID=2675110 RepID=UPI001F0BAEB8|nr:fimbria/pilus outer membrane usher protein [Serratia microhaemolytica]
MLFDALNKATASHLMGNKTMKIYSPPRHVLSLGGHFLKHPLTWCLLLTFSPAWAADYFDPDFLKDMGEGADIDLSAFSEAGGIAPGEYTVWVFINQRSAGQYTLNFQKNAQGKVEPVLTPVQLETLGVNVTQVPELKDLAKDAQIDSLGTLIPQATTKLDLPRLRLDISVPQIAMQQELRGVVDPEQWQDGISALTANYSFSAGRNTNTGQNNKTETNTLFGTVRAGANVGPWRLRSTVTHTRIEYSGRVNQPDSTKSDTRVSNTYLYRDISRLRSTLLLGETSTGGDVFDAFSFRGMQLKSNEQMLPVQLRGYSPAVSGFANSNARITVRQSGNVVYETYVAPGPFSINTIPQAGLSGNYDVTVTEADGTQRRFVVPYSSLPVMLRPGGWKYELTTGRYDGNLTDSSREALFVMGTGVYGLPKGFTLYAGVLGANDYQSASLGTGISLGYLGAISADVTHSIAKFEDDTNKSGQSYRLRYSKSTLSSGTTVDLTALRYSTRDFYSFSEFNSRNYQLTEGVSPWLLQRRRSSLQTQISQQLGDWGSFSFRANRDDFWGSDRSLTGLSFNYNNSFKGISYGINYNIDRVKDSKGEWPENRQISFSVSVPFSVFGYAQQLQSMYATASITHDNSGRTQNQVGLMGSMLDGRVSYGATQNWGNQGQATSTNLNAGYQGNRGSLSAGYSYSNTAQSVNMNASGGLLVHGGGVTFSRAMGESMALVHVPQAPNVRVGGETMRTDWRGYAVVPYLTDYVRNSVGIDPSSLPEGVDVAQTNVNVYPTHGAIVKANFATRVGHQVLMTLKYGSGVVPFGAMATVLNAAGDEENASIVGDGGQVYLTGLPESGTLLVKWGETDNRQCLVNFNVATLSNSPDRPLRQATYSCNAK